jgi:hypothetical protein
MQPTTFADQLPPDDQWLLDGQVLFLGSARRASYQTGLKEALPELTDHMTLVGYDWLGRPIGVPVGGNATVLVYDAIFDELMEFPIPNGRLLSSPLFDVGLDNFGRDEYVSFLKRAAVPRLAIGLCAGFTVPPQLGGEVSSSNLEVYEVQAYWYLVSLLQEAIGTLSEGTVLKSLKLK